MEKGNIRYAVEKQGRHQGLDPDGIRDLRQRESKPVLDEFKVWLDAKVLVTPPKGLLGKAINYTLNNWKRLLRYLEDGRLRPDNNLAENAIRPFVVGRKNWLFAGSPEGARAAAVFYSLIETAKANGWRRPTIISPSCSKTCRSLIPMKNTESCSPSTAPNRPGALSNCWGCGSPNAYRGGVDAEIERRTICGIKDALKAMA